MGSGEWDPIRAHFSHVQWKKQSKRWRAGVEVSWILRSDHGVVCVCVCVVLITCTYTDPNAFQIKFPIPPSFKSGTLMNGEIENPHIDVIFLPM